MVKDTGVQIKGTSLNNCHILFAISGGIAATESIKIARELRRFQANVTILMSKEAEKIITPLAVSWASDSDILTDWNPKMKQLEKYDAILVAPATRNTISTHIHGIMDSPMMMALSSARGSKTPMLFVPSMHKDIFDDPVTSDLISKLIDEGSEVLLEKENEGKIKQAEPVKIVAKLCNMVNSKLPNRKKIAITLGANRAEIDSIRSIINTSSGKTGWFLSEYLYRHGHDITCIVGHTTVSPNFDLSDVRFCQSPTNMLESCVSLASSEAPPQAWIHVAAVLDYYPTPEVGKKSSGLDEWNINLMPGPKHISHLSPLVNGTIRIGFKLESNVSNEKLIETAFNQLNKYNLNAVIGNMKEHIQDDNLPRGIIVLPDGSTKILKTNLDMCSNIESIISN
ncbi:MAG: phosphopantothenoylcysteine decarboxylase/phosphopantothenate--cysteine ligase [Candidatus Thalassarchaeaceae archaeon]|jgi:phosphopantothenoylcysteine decarboxylase/phosphopantothenate--cysteine ligase